MCRLLTVRSPVPRNHGRIFRDFAYMAEKSRTMDGDRQGDGWGAAWLDNQGEWQRYRSLLPVWKERDFATKLPKTTSLVLHARAASFPNQKGIMALNQPYMNGQYVFTFNGMVRGVKLPQPVPGSIGAQKFFNLFLSLAKTNEPAKALELCRRRITEYSSEIQGLNIVISTPEKTWSLSLNPSQYQYFDLQRAQRDDLKIVCSEPLPGFNWVTVPTATTSSL